MAEVLYADAVGSMRAKAKSAVGTGKDTLRKVLVVASTTALHVLDAETGLYLLPKALIPFPLTQLFQIHHFVVGVSCGLASVASV